MADDEEYLSMPVPPDHSGADADMDEQRSAEQARKDKKGSCADDVLDVLNTVDITLRCGDVVASSLGRAKSVPGKAGRAVFPLLPGTPVESMPSELVPLLPEQPLDFLPSDAVDAARGISEVSAGAVETAAEFAETASGAVEAASAVAETAAGAIEAAGGAADALSGIADVAGDIAEAAGIVVEGLFTLLD